VPLVNDRLDSKPYGHNKMSVSYTLDRVKVDAPIFKS